METNRITYRMGFPELLHKAPRWGAGDAEELSRLPWRQGQVLVGLSSRLQTADFSLYSHMGEAASSSLASSHKDTNSTHEGSTLTA